MYVVITQTRKNPMLNIYLQILFERQQAFDLLGYFPLFEQFP